MDVIAPGARILVRDAEWLVRRVDRTSTGGLSIQATGISELVRDKEATFLSEIDHSIDVLDPAKTKLVPDSSPGFQASLLYLESLLRKTPPTDDRLYIGHKAAMDPVAYQLDPAAEALQQPRQRYLIADAVGLGKTLEAGILLSELIRRGRGKRILVACIKSMLTQFQKEMWSRFTIPLVRLDSVGIQRIRSRIPTNHNPFYYFDRAIISIDTLKQDSEYRNYLENAYWDIIVIDEAQNVAERGKSSSLRSKLAKLLARRSDTLIMLSATPHDGRARSFASLMNMLDPTAIANPDDYTKEDIKKLYIRRFKKDIQDQVEHAFKERQIRVAHCDASPAEETAFDVLEGIRFSKLDQRKGANILVKTGLEKALFSSPCACLQTIGNRVRKLENSEDPDYLHDIAQLRDLEAAVTAITPDRFSKYQRLLEVIRDPDHGLGWTGRDKTDRLVIFTERIETLKFLRKHLPEDLALKDEQVRTLYGTLADVDQQRIVDEFGQEESSARLLLASDVASEGINLHYLSHRMIHFDIPWSLMVFQQRNGRIDRYGQTETPQIIYLVTLSKNAKIRGDTRILELLIEKDEEATKNIGDPASLMNVYDIEEEELITGKAIEEGKTAEDFEKDLERRAKTFDPLALLLGSDSPPTGSESVELKTGMPSLFPSNFAYLQSALERIEATHSQSVRPEFLEEQQTIEFHIPADLKSRFRFLPSEVQPRDGFVTLCEDKQIIQEEIRRSRKDEVTWPRMQYLWELNPVVEWVNDKVLAAFGRHEAPVISLPDTLNPGEVIFLASGLIPNRKAHPLVHLWLGIQFMDGNWKEVISLERVIQRVGLGRRQFPNPRRDIDTAELEEMLPTAVEVAREWVIERRDRFENQINQRLNEELENLERLKKRKFEQINLRFEAMRQPEAILAGRRAAEQRRTQQIFDDYMEWVQDTMTTEKEPYIQVAAVLRRSS